MKSSPLRCDFSAVMIKVARDSHDDSNQHRPLISQSAALGSPLAPAGARRSAALQPHELRGRGRDRDRGQGRGRDPRLVPDRSRPVPHRAAGHAAGRDALPPRPRAAGLRRLAAAAGGHADFCVGADNFVLPRREAATAPASSIARFTAVKPTETEKGLIAYLAEDAEYTDEQARDAGIQRLLVIAGYDADPIDGIRGAKTDAALVQFIADNKLENTAAGRSDFFDMLIAAAQKPDGAGFAWCNETAQRRDGGARRRGAGRGRRPAAGTGSRPASACAPTSPASRGGSTASARRSAPTASRCKRADARRMAWGGSTILCTRNVKFELTDHKDCAGSGLTATGFATVELAGSSRDHGAIQVIAVAHALRRGDETVHSSPHEHAASDQIRARAASARSRPGCSTSTTRSIRTTSISGSRSTIASARSSRISCKRHQGRGVPRPEGLLQALRHHHARADGRARHEARRLSGVRARDRPFAAGAEPGAGRRDREAARPQADPHQRHPQARRGGDEAARHRPSFRGRVRHRRRRPRSQAAAAGLRPLPAQARRRSAQGRDVRGPGAQSRACRTRSA